MVGVVVIEVSTADDDLGARIDAHDLGDVGRGGATAGEDDVVPEVVAEQRL